MSLYDMGLVGRIGNKENFLKVGENGQYVVNSPIAADTIIALCGGNTFQGSYYSVIPASSHKTIYSVKNMRASDYMIVTELNIELVTTTATDGSNFVVYKGGTGTPAGGSLINTYPINSNTALSATTQIEFRRHTNITGITAGSQYCQRLLHVGSTRQHLFTEGIIIKPSEILYVTSDSSSLGVAVGIRGFFLDITKM